MIVVGAPMTGDILQAQKRERPQKEIHGKGFKEIFEEALWQEKVKTLAEDAQSASDAAGETVTRQTLYATPAVTVGSMSFGR